MPVFDQRVAGYCQAMDEANLSHNAANVYWGEFSQSMGYEMAERALQGAPRPTALLAVNNFIANGALRALRDKGIRVPEDISVVSFDDIPVSINPMPFLTVAAQPAYEMGYQATQLLVARLANEGPDTVQKIILPVEILVRQSSGPPPQTEGNA